MSSFFHWAQCQGFAFISEQELFWIYNSYSTFFFFQHLEYVIWLPSGLHDRWLEVSSYSNWRCLEHNKWLSLGAFKMPSLSFSSFTRLCLGVGIFEFFLFSVHWASWMNDVFSLIWGIWGYYFLQYSFFPILSHNSPSGNHIMFTFLWLMLSHRSLSLC